MSLLLLLAACSSSQPEVPRSDAQAAGEAAARLCTLVSRVGQPCTAEGSVVRLGEERTMAAEARIVEEVVLGSAATATWEWSWSVDGAPQRTWTARASGSGSSLEEARSAAAEEWARTYGAGLMDGLRHDGSLTVLQSLQDDQSPPPVFVVGDWWVYAGWTSLKGRMKERQPVRIEAILEHLEPLTTSWSADDGWHTMTVAISFRDGFAPEGECTLDGQFDDTVCEAAQQWEWPAPNGQYLVKQYLVFRPALPEGLPGSEPTEAPAQAEEAEAAPE